VVAEFDGGSARAAVLPVRTSLARRFGEAAFRLFVVELPLAAADGTVVLRTSDRAIRWLGAGAAGSEAGAR
jgi:hypothetical protein